MKIKNCKLPVYLGMCLITFTFSSCSCAIFNIQISEVKTATRINSKTLEPLETTSVFYQADEVIYCVANIKDLLNKQSTIRADWVYLKDNSKISSETQKIRGTGFVAFQMKKPEDGWPKGKYRVEVFLGDQKYASDFEIK